MLAWAAVDSASEAGSEHLFLNDDTGYRVDVVLSLHAVFCENYLIVEDAVPAVQTSGGEGGLICGDAGGL